MKNTYDDRILQRNESQFELWDPCTPELCRMRVRIQQDRECSSLVWLRFSQRNFAFRSLFVDENFEQYGMETAT